MQSLTLLFLFFARAAQPCTVEETARVRIELDGRAVYIEPDVVSLSGGSLLLAGLPSYVMDLRTADRPAVAADSLMGIVLPSAGRARAITSPIGRSVRHIRAAARPDGGWDVVFAETEAAPVTSRQVARRLYAGVLSDGRWLTVDTLPDVAGGERHSFSSSRLVRSADTLLWAMRVQGPSGQSVVVYERIGGKWRADSIRTGAAYVQAMHSARVGFGLLTVGADSTLPLDANSLFLRTRAAGWRDGRKLVPGGSARVHLPVVADAEDRHLLAWSVEAFDTGAPWLSRAVMMAMNDALPPIQTADSAVAFQVPVHMADGERLLVLEHREVPDRPGELRILRAVGGAFTEIWRNATPYHGPFAAIADPSGDLLLAGPLLDLTSRPQRLQTLILRLRVRCTDRPERH